MQAHQRNLRAVADWSYELLEESERMVFERLSVFADGATIDATQHVCATASVSAAGVERLLDRLVDKSLVLADRSGGRTRFRMLQTLADYASERLDVRDTRDGDAPRPRSVGPRAGEDRRVRRRDRWRHPSRPYKMRTSPSTTAIGWSLTAEPTMALEICSALSAFWFGTIRVSVGWEWLSSTLFAAGTGRSSTTRIGVGMGDRVRHHGAGHRNCGATRRQTRCPSNVPWAIPPATRQDLFRTHDRRWLSQR